MKGEEYLTVSQVAEKLNLTENYIYRLAKLENDPIPSVRIGRRVRFGLRQVEKWLESRSRKC